MPNKQHDARAASLKRVAKSLRATAKSEPNALVLKFVAKALDAEAKLLRSMR